MIIIIIIIIVFIILKLGSWPSLDATFMPD